MYILYIIYLKGWVRESVTACSLWLAVQAEKFPSAQMMVSSC